MMVCLSRAGTIALSSCVSNSYYPQMDSIGSINNQQTGPAPNFLKSVNLFMLINYPKPIDE
jgi:hypothetical protein